MTDETKKRYTRRIAEANKSEIIVIVFELAEIYIEDAVESYYDGDLENYAINCKKAVRCITDLLDSLDYSYEISYPLMRIYNYLSSEISVAAVTKEVGKLKKAEEFLTRIKLSFVDVAKADTSSPVMGNTQTVYAGLTYGKNELNESYNSESNRGFTV